MPAFRCRNCQCVREMTQVAGGAVCTNCHTMHYVDLEKSAKQAFPTRGAGIGLNMSGLLGAPQRTVEIQNRRPSWGKSQSRKSKKSTPRQT